MEGGAGDDEGSESDEDAVVDKLWALCVRDDEKLIASGGIGSVITLWEDNTKVVVCFPQFLDSHA